jgi:hypothetical protein
MTRSLHRAFRNASFRVVVALALFSPAFANTIWIVDQANGPGTNFTSIPPAIAASVAGDVIIIRQGTYSAFTLDRGVTLLGQGNVYVSSWLFVRDVPASDVAALYNVEPQANWNAISIDNCAGTVLVQRCDSPIQVRNCSDVRLRDVTTGTFGFGAHHGLFVQDSRVEVVGSTLRGQDSSAGWCEFVENGGDGILCLGASQLLLSRTTATGGKGGIADNCCLCWPPNANGANGKGLHVEGAGSAALVVLDGPGQLSGPNGLGDSAIFGAGVTAWNSNMTFVGNPPLVSSGAMLTDTPTDEPTLELIGTPAPNTLVTLRLRATPGVAVRLNLGRIPIAQPQPGILVDGLVLKERSFDRGIVPPSGILDTPWFFQPGAAPGKLLIFQVKVTDPFTNVTQKSNSIETIVQ